MEAVQIFYFITEKIRHNCIRMAKGVGEWQATYGPDQLRELIRLTGVEGPMA